MKPLKVSRLVRPGDFCVIRGGTIRRTGPKDKYHGIWMGATRATILDPATGQIVEYYTPAGLGIKGEFGAAAENASTTT